MCVPALTPSVAKCYGTISELVSSGGLRGNQDDRVVAQDQWMFFF